MSVGFENTSAASVARNIDNGSGVERHAASSPAERLAILDTLFSNQDFSAGFSKFVKDQEANTSRTYNDMNDRELMGRLSEYLGSGVINVSINNNEIETAQAVVAELYMSDEELAELDSAVSARATRAKQAKNDEDRTKEFFEAEAERKLEEHRAQWDAQMHKIGDKEYSGAELHAMHEWLKDPKNEDELDKEIMARDGVSKEEAKRRRTELQELLALMEKKRNNQELSPEEKLRFKELQDKPTVQRNLEIVKALEDRGQTTALNNSNSAMRVGDEDTSVQEGLRELSESPKVTAPSDAKKTTWSSSAPFVKVEEGLSTSYNAAAVGKVDAPKILASEQTLAKAVGISEPSPYG